MLQNTGTSAPVSKHKLVTTVAWRRDGKTEYALEGSVFIGGAVVLLQFQADLLGVSVARPEVTETTALGAAYLAGLAARVWKDTAEIARQRKVERVFEPRISRDQAKALRVRWSKALDRAREWGTA